ncbi:Tropomyosin, partial [Bienertia sinuspersici]
QVHNQGVQYQQKADTHLQNIDTQIGQICTSLSNLESQLSGELPSQPHPNPKEQVNRVILREPEEANELEELEVVSDESSNTIKLLDAINCSFESNGEKIELNMIDKDLIPEANATDYVANSLEQI